MSFVVYEARLNVGRWEAHERDRWNIYRRGRGIKARRPLAICRLPAARRIQYSAPRRVLQLNAMLM